MLHEEHLYSIALRATPLIGDVNFMRLVEITGSAIDIPPTTCF